MRTKICVILLFAVPCFAYTWTPYGPDEAGVNGWLFHQDPPVYSVLCTTTGLQLDQGSGWIPYSYGDLPCEGATELDAQRILVALGDSSWSDGVYAFDLTTHQFQVATWCIHPRFLVHYPDLGVYYAGDDFGLQVSPNGFNWTYVSGFGEPCFSMAQHGDHLVVAADTLVYWSGDAGSTWNQAEPGTPFLRGLAFTQDGTLVGAAPGKWTGSGVWTSTDFGNTWEHEFWSLFMTSVAVDWGGTAFVGWNNPGSGGFQDCGVAMWNPGSDELVYLNAALPETLVNALGSNPLVDCPSIMCGTVAGAYYLTGYLAAPELSIQQTGPSTARLSWAPSGSPTFVDIYRSMDAYLTGSGPAWATVDGTLVQYDVTDGIGDESVDYYYVVRGRDATQTSPRSQAVGDADFLLVNPPR